MEKSPSLETTRSSANQEIPRILYDPEVSLPHSQEPVDCPYHEAAQSILTISLDEDPF
jgi:hypothetical protein